MADGRTPDRRRAHHSTGEPSPWEQEVYHEHISGNSYRKLAEKYDCSHEHIGKIVRRVIAWKRPQIGQTITDATDKLIDAHWQAYEQAMNAWEESRGQMVRETVTKQQGRVDRDGNQLGEEIRTERRYNSAWKRCVEKVTATKTRMDSEHGRFLVRRPYPPRRAN